MSRWQPGARERLAAAALDLFEQQGFARTTVPQIAAEAGVTNRTFYRYFGDKRDVVFDTDSAGPTDIASALDDIPAGLSLGEFVERCSVALVRARFPGPRTDERRRRRVIAADESLRERSAHKRDVQHALLGGILAARDVPPERARLLAEVMTSAMNLAVDEWLERDDEAGPEALVVTALDSLRRDLGIP